MTKTQLKESVTQGGKFGKSKGEWLAHEEIKNRNWTLPQN